MAFDKIDVSEVVSQHLDTLRHRRRDSRRPGDLLLFYGLPMLASLAVWVNDLSFIRTSALLTGLALLSGFLLTLLIQMFDIAARLSVDRGERDGHLQPAEREQEQARLIVIREVYATLAYAFLVSLLAVVVLLVATLPLGGTQGIGPVWSATITYLSVHLLLTLLMILKRSFLVLGSEVSDLPDKFDRRGGSGTAA